MNSTLPYNADHFCNPVRCRIAARRPLRTLLLTVLCLAVSACQSVPIGRDTSETVILLHGLARSGFSMWLLEYRLEEYGYRVETIDYSTLWTSPDEALAEIASDIEACCRNRSRLHFVGHSLGGLMIRSYLARTDSQWVRQRLGQVVLIGTPNKGSPVVDHLAGSFWLDLAGETTRSLGTEPESYPNQLPAPDYPVGVIAGRSPWFFSDSVFGEPNDGLVAVSSAKLATMSDFIEMDVSHSMMRYDSDVAYQTAYYLRQGRFDNTSSTD